MSGKSSIILTADNEHWYEDCGELLANDKNAISLEFNKRNIRIDNEDDEAFKRVFEKTGAQIECTYALVF